MNVARSSSSFVYGNDILFWAIFHILYVIWILWNCKMVNQWTVRGYIFFWCAFRAGCGVFNDLRSGWGVPLFNDPGWNMMKLERFRSRRYRWVDCLFIIKCIVLSGAKPFSVGCSYIICAMNTRPKFICGKFCLELYNVIFCTTGKNTS